VVQLQRVRVCFSTQGKSASSLFSLQAFNLPAKLLRPEFSDILSKDEEKEILSLINRHIKALVSSDVTIDDRHAPKLWSRFLEELMAKRTRDANKAAASSPAASGSVNGTAPQTTYAPAPQVLSHVLPAPVMPHAHYAAASPQALTNGHFPPEFQWAQHPATMGLGFIAHDGVASVAGASTTAAYPPTASAFNFDFNSMMAVDNDATLATMAAIENPGFWENMMMPG
jgi:hypothetical protein